MGYNIFENKKIGIIYGSDTGNTQDVTDDIVAEMSNYEDFPEPQIIEASELKIKDFTSFDFLILGLSTWYDGELQSDFDDFFEQFKTIDFTNKIIALYGLGDQYGYSEYFVDGLGILGDEIVKNGGKIIGNWPIEGYEFDASKGLVDQNHFYGLALDNENQLHLHDERIEKWVQSLISELRLCFENKRVLTHI